MATTKKKSHGGSKTAAAPAVGHEALFQWNGTPPLGSTVSLALQHLVAMIVGCVTPAIIVSGSAGLSAEDSVLLIQTSLVVSALTTLIQLYPLGRKFGSGLPIIMGVSFAYVPSMQAIAEQGKLAGDPKTGIAMIMGGMLVGGIVAVLVGFFVRKIRILFPPIITGTVVFTIGLSLYATAVNYMAGGTANTAESIASRGLSESLVYGSWQNWLVAFITLAFVLILNHTKGVFKLASILIGMLVGYIVALMFGMVDFSGLNGAAPVAMPSPLHFGVQFELGACLSLGLLFAINSVQAIGDFTATTIGGMDRDPSDQELQGGIIAYGASNIVGSLLGGLPTATYSQNVGIVSTNKVINRKVFALTGVLMLIAGISPVFAALLRTIPQCVLGGATVTVFSSIAMTGMKLIASQNLNNPRNTTIVGLSAALGVGVSQASASLGQFPETVQMVFGKSPVVIATIMAIFLNLILPQDKVEKP